MRPKFLVGVIVGLLLVYLSFFGISGFGLALPGGAQDFTTYTKMDSGNYFTVSSTAITVTNMPRSSTSVIYKGFGSIGAFDITFSAISSRCEKVFALLGLTKGTTSVSGGSVMTVFYWLALQDEFYPGMPSGLCFGINTYNANGVRTNLLSTTGAVALGTSYSIRLTRVGTTVTLQIQGFGALTFTDATDYTTVLLCPGIGYSASDIVSGTVSNLVFGGATAYSDVTISVSGQGTTVPAAGHYGTTYPQGGSLTITATPAPGWAFDYMTRNGATTSSMTLTSLGALEQVVVYFKTGGATTGTLRVFASYNGAYVVASITASGPQTVYGSTTTDPNNPLSLTVLAGTYSVSGTYSPGSATPVSVTVPAGGSVDANLNFGGPSPTPDLLALIKVFFALLPVKVVLFLSGLGSAIGCGIMFMMKGKGERPRSPPYYSPY